MWDNDIHTMYSRENEKALTHRYQEIFKTKSTYNTEIKWRNLEGQMNPTLNF